MSRYKKPYNKVKKHFGQHFLIDERCLEQIAASLYFDEETQLIEIGPGTGQLTSYLLKKDKPLTCIELDRDLIEGLKISFNYQVKNKQLTIIQADALKFDFSVFDAPLEIAGNLPYNISSQLIIRFCSMHSQIRSMHFLIQKEMADRLCAQCDSKDYGRFTLAIWFWAESRALFDIGPESFDPPPKVQSSFVQIEPRTTLPAQQTLFTPFMQVVTTAFSQRRKKISNSLSPLFSSEELVNNQISPDVRAENIRPEEYIRLAEYLVKRT